MRQGASKTQKKRSLVCLEVTNNFKSLMTSAQIFEVALNAFRASNPKSQREIDIAAHIHTITTDHLIKAEKLENHKR
jgi:hypothetical protein